MEVSHYDNSQNNLLLWCLITQHTTQLAKLGPTCLVFDYLRSVTITIPNWTSMSSLLLQGTASTTWTSNVGNFITWHLTTRIGSLPLVACLFCLQLICNIHSTLLELIHENGRFDVALLVSIPKADMQSVADATTAECSLCFLNKVTQPWVITTMAMKGSTAKSKQCYNMCISYSYINRPETNLLESPLFSFQHFTKNVPNLLTIFA